MGNLATITFYCDNIHEIQKDKVGFAAASFHMTTADYEDPEDLVVAAKRSADELYSIVYNELKCSGGGCDRMTIPFDQMTTEESKIYDSLLNVRSKNFNRAIR